MSQETLKQRISAGLNFSYALALKPTRDTKTKEDSQKLPSSIHAGQEG